MSTVQVFYGYLLLPLDKCIKKLQIVWRKSMRQVWKLPYRTHCQIVSNLSSKLCEFHMLIKRNLNFALKCINHSIAFVKYLFTCAMNSDKSVFQRNVKFCCQNLDLMIYDELTDVDNDIIFIKCEQLCKTQNALNLTHSVKELSLIRDNVAFSVINSSEAKMIIDDICIN